MPVNVQAAIAKWKTNMGGAGEKMKAGVQAVTVSPTQAAAQAVDKYLAGVQDAVTSGRLVAGLQSVSTTDWQNSMIQKGIPNMQNGVRNLDARAQAAMSDVLTYTQTVSDQIRSMPNATDNDAKNRMMKAFDLMKAYKRR